MQFNRKQLRTIFGHRTWNPSESGRSRAVPGSLGVDINILCRLFQYQCHQTTESVDVDTISHFSGVIYV